MTKRYSDAEIRRALEDLTTLYPMDEHTRQDAISWLWSHGMPTLADRRSQRRRQRQNSR